MEKGSLDQIGAMPGDLVICLGWLDSADEWDRRHTEYQPGDIYGVKIRGNSKYLDKPGNWLGTKAYWAIHEETYDIKELL